MLALAMYIAEQVARTFFVTEEATDSVGDVSCTISEKMSLVHERTIHVCISIDICMLHK